MKPRARPIKNLYFRWGRAVGLTGEQVAKFLKFHGLITLTPDGGHYFETPAAKEIKDFNEHVTKLLKGESL